MSVSVLTERGHCAVKDAAPRHGTAVPHIPKQQQNTSYIAAMSQEIARRRNDPANAVALNDYYHRIIGAPWEQIQGHEVRDAVKFRWLAAQENDLTIKAYERDLDHYFAWCEASRIDVMSAIRSNIDTYSTFLRKAGMRPASVSRHISSLSGFYKYACSENVIVRSPVEFAKRPKVPKDSQQVGLDQFEVVRFMTEAAWYQSPIAGTRDRDRAWALVALLAYDGLRISEALTADVTSLSTSQGHRVLEVTRKGGAKQTVALNPATSHALDLYIADRTEGPIFLTSVGNRWHRTSAFRTVKVIAKRAGLSSKVGPHSLRHTFVTLSREFGVSLEDVQDAAGHASADTTRRYDRARFNLTGHPAYVLGQKLVVNLPPRDAS